ncbi:MAG: aldo/keto reductase [Rhodothermales bacterium]
MVYNRCGRSGLRLPALSLGLWQNFGWHDAYDTSRSIVLRAFDLGISCFDLANNYGPPSGAAESTFGHILATDLAAHRDEIVVATKAGFPMWDGPYGGCGSKKHLVASLDQSLRRLGVDYVDIFYHHRPDPETPLEETVRALDQIVRSGKALYVGLSNYAPEYTKKAVAMMRSLGTPCIVHQPAYNMFNRSIEAGLLPLLGQAKMGCVVYSPLAQGMLTNKYLEGIPDDSRAGKAHGLLQPEQVNERRMTQVRQLNELAKARGQSLAQMALAWILRRPEITSAILGASRVSQLEDAIDALRSVLFDEEELHRIEDILAG